jgi:hypothetical protein
MEAYPELMHFHLYTKINDYERLIDLGNDNHEKFRSLLNKVRNKLYIYI